MHTAKAYYDPGTQRWLNRDPIGDAFGLHEALRTDLQLTLTLTDNAFANLYAFNYNNTLGFIDADGRIALPVVIGGGIAAAYLGGVIICHFYPPCARAAEQAGRGIAEGVREICRARPRPEPSDCTLLYSTEGLCVYKCSSPVGSFMGAIPKPPGGCPQEASIDDVKPMPGRDYPGFPPN